MFTQASHWTQDKPLELIHIFIPFFVMVLYNTLILYTHSHQNHPIGLLIFGLTDVVYYACFIDWMMLLLTMYINQFSNPNIVLSGLFLTESVFCVSLRVIYCNVDRNIWRTGDISGGLSCL